LSDLADIKHVNGDLAETVMYGERVLKLDPLYDWARITLLSAYLDFDEVEAARQVDDEAPHRVPYRRLRIMIHDGDWHRAAETTYEALADGTNLVTNEPWSVLALRVDARTTRDFGRARAALDRLCGARWNAQGAPMVPSQIGV